MNITIVGLGVIGGSCAMALAKKTQYNIFAIDIDKNTIQTAKKTDLIVDGAILNTKEANNIIKKTDLLILCIYPKDIIDFINNYKQNFKENLLITDVTGIKQIIVQDIKEVLPQNVDFVFSHPMGGREKKGLEYATEKVFKNANYLIVPQDENKAKSIETIEQLAKDMGFGNIEKISVSAHDQLIAITSQLPHALAVALVNSNKNIDDIFNYTGDSYKEFTRIANINEDLWAQLFLGNRENLIDQIEHFEVELSKIKETLLGKNKEKLMELFIESSNKMDKILGN